MDRRYNQRITADLPVLLTLLESEEQARGKLLDLSESGIGGHVAHSKPEGAGFRTGIFVEPALLDASNLVELVNSFLVSHVG